jgi:hypothetical protein
MAALPDHRAQILIERIYAAYEAAEARGDVYLGRLGASFLGDDCVRRTWLSWRAYAAPKFDGRMLRLFETGHQQEARIVDDLRAAGLSVWDRDPDTEQQIEYVDDTGHFIVKLDGVVKGVPDTDNAPHVLEIKTHNAKSFAQLSKAGVKAAKPGHYVQMQAGMALSGIQQALYVAVCKDDEHFYIERVEADPEVQKQAGHRIGSLVFATIKPAGISPTADAPGCRYCDMKEVCAGREEPVKTCRSCRHSDPSAVPNEWVCHLSGEMLTKAAQRRACEEYECL